MEAANNRGRVRDLLIVDDDPGQARLFTILLEELGVRHRCHHSPSGLEALNFLHRGPPFQNAMRPELIILDLHMPGMDGCAVLKAIKCDPDLRSIPVIMFSATDCQADFDRCYREQANACVRKARDYEGGIRIVREIEQFWLQVAESPS